LSAFFDLTEESVMGLAEYMIVAQRSEWGVWHDGSINNRYATKESAFEAAVGAASLAIREGHEVRLSVPDRSAGNQTALGGRGADVGRLPCASWDLPIGWLPGAAGYGAGTAISGLTGGQ
jgi:hypothetical protein